MNLGIRTRLLIALVGLVLAVQGVSLLLVLDSTYGSLFLQATRNLGVAESVFDRALGNRTRQLRDSVEVLVNDFGFKRAVVTSDAPTIQLALVNQGRRVDADLMAMFDPDGALVVATVPVPESHARAFGIDNPRTAGQGDRGFVLLDDTAYQMAVAAVQAPDLVGWIEAGFAVDDDLPRLVRDLAKAEVSFVTRDRVLASTLHDMDRRGLLAAWTSGTPVQGARTLDLPGDRHIARRVSLLADGSLDAILQIPMGRALEGYATLRAELLLISGLSLSAALLIALALANGLSRPIRALTSAARRIRDGFYDVKLPVDGGEELAGLATAFNRMQVAIAEREAEILYRSQHDMLTDLPSRAIVNDRIETALTRSVRNGRPFSVAILDVSRFREVNDALGDEVGDEVLVQLARRMREEVRESDTLARIGGDEFLIVLEQLTVEQALARLASIQGALEAPVQFSDMVVRVRTQVGVCFAPQDGTTARQLLRRAEIALSGAKEAQVRICRYREGEDEDHLYRIALVRDMKHAIASDQMHLRFQPKVDAATGVICQAEALVRWMHPEHGFVSPEQFIMLAEQSGHIGALTDWVLARCVDQLRRWRERGIGVRLAVNLSVLDLLDTTLPDRVARLLFEAHVPPNCLTLEITESAVMRDAERARSVLLRLRELGTVLSIDDFGTGHASLAQLKRMPVQELKIDKSFVLDMLEDPDDAVIVKSTIDLAHNMGLGVVAEGVETDAHRERLAAWGCDSLQGYLFSRPLPEDEFDEWLSRQRYEEAAS